MRLFTAIEIPPGIRTRLSALVEQLRPLAKLQWSPPEKLHITITFIGEWPEARLDELHVALAQVRSGPIPISICGISWMSRHVLSAGVEATPALVALASSTGNALGAIGVPLEKRDYHPHITLARRKSRGPLPRLEPPLSALRSADLGAFQSSKFVLYRSDQGKYTQLKEYTF
jgi:2'-5' RNA ligase